MPHVRGDALFLPRTQPVPAHIFPAHAAPPESFDLALPALQSARDHRRRRVDLIEYRRLRFYPLAHERQLPQAALHTSQH